MTNNHVLGQEAARVLLSPSSQSQFRHSNLADRLCLFELAHGRLVVTCLLFACLTKVLGKLVRFESIVKKYVLISLTKCSYQLLNYPLL